MHRGSLSHKFKFMERIQAENRNYIPLNARTNSQDGPSAFQPVLEEPWCTSAKHTHIIWQCPELILLWREVCSQKGVKTPLCS